MRAIASEAVKAAVPLSAEDQAAALWTFVQLRTPCFASAEALQVVREFAPVAGEDLKALAKRLKAALAANGIGLKHTHTLDDDARLLGHKSRHAGAVSRCAYPRSYGATSLASTDRLRAGKRP